MAESCARYSLTIMRPHTIEDIEYDLSLLYEKESVGMTQAALALREGMSEGHLSRRLARARRYRAEKAEADRLSEAPPDDGRDRFDRTYMELVGVPPEASAHDWSTDSDPRNSRQQGVFNVGGSVRWLRDGTVTTEDTSRTDGKPQPTEYHPDPLLKGGKGR